MEVVAKSKYVRISPKKVNRVLKLIRNKSVVESSNILKLLPHRASDKVLKTLNSAVANAKNNNDLNEELLTVSRAVVNEGVRLKRYRPRARGGASMILKRTSNIEITVKSKEVV